MTRALHIEGLPVTRALHIEDLSFRFADGTAALRNVSAALDQGESVGLLGPNGAGKSTLLLHLNGILPDGAGGRSHGRIEVLGRRIERSSLPWVRQQIGLLFQDPDDQLFCATVGEDVAFGPTQWGLDRDEIARRVSRALEAVGLAGFEDRMPHRMSGGEKKRACLAGLLACDPKILVLDEPTAGLDPRGRRQFIELVKQLPTTKLVATHDLAMVAELCPRALLLDRGELIADGATADLLTDDALMMAHGLECPRRELGELLVAAEVRRSQSPTEHR